MSGAERCRVLVTHADRPLGRRIVKRLFHDEQVESLVTAGHGPPPRSFDHFLASSGGRLRYEQVELGNHHAVAELFRSVENQPRPVDSVVHVPRHGPSDAPERRLVAGVSSRIAEARLVFHECLQSRSIHNLVVLGSAFVYRLTPGNSNRLTEDSELNFDPDAPAELRSWIDCDGVFRGDVHRRDIRVVLLRVPTVVTSGGDVFLNPSLSPDEYGRGSGPVVQPLGYDPICALIADKDVARAVRQALHERVSGVYNVAGSEALPLSVLSNWAGRRSLRLPGPMLRVASRAARSIGSSWRQVYLHGPHIRYGFTLDTSRAERELGFLPSYRIGLTRAGDGRPRIETAAIS